MKNTAKTLTDLEISIIKKLLEQGRPNQEVMGIINLKRGDPSLHINFGRISDIKNGKNKRSLVISSATDLELEQFLSKNNQSNENQAKILKERGFELPIKSKNPLILDIAESDIIECKATFSKDTKNLLKPLCALANNKGGYILYGVENQTWKVIGISNKGVQSFNDWDLESLDSSILSYLSCGIEINKEIIKIDDKCIAVLRIEKAKRKPVIFINNICCDGENIAIGDIFYRYAGSSRKIGPGELEQIIEERANINLKGLFLKQIETIIQNGIENSAILNVQTGEVEGKSGNFVIDESLLPKIQFIKEGEFVEKKGAPTLKLVGDVRSLNEILKVEVATNVTIDIKEILSSFLNNNPPQKPREYIKSLALSSRKWAPLFYFIRSGGNSNKAVVEYLNRLKDEENISYPQKQIDMINQNKFPTFSSKDKETYIDIIKRQENISFNNEKECILFCIGIAHVTKEHINLAYCKKYLKLIMENFWGNKEVKDTLIKISSYLDILFYKNG